MKIKSLNIKSLNKTYIVKKKHIKALKDFSLLIEAGKILSVLGPNGAGKSTLLKILCGLILPESGQVLLNNEIDIIKNNKIIKTNLGFLPSTERSFYYRLSGWINLEFFSVLKNIRKKERKEELQKTLKLVNFPMDIIQRPYMTYSRGEKQKLGIARSFLNNPSILLFDEPTTGLDPLAQCELRNIIKKLKEKKKIVILCTHNLLEAEELSDQIIILHKGEIKQKGSLKTLKNIGCKKYISLFVKNLNQKDSIKRFLKLNFNLDTTYENGILDFEVEENTDLKNILLYLTNLLQKDKFISNFKVEDLSLEKIFSKTFDLFNN